MLKDIDKRTINKMPYERRGAGVQGWEELLDAMIVSSTNVSASTFGNDALLCPDFNIPRFYLAPGRTLRFQLWGDIMVPSGTVGTITFKVKWGGLGGTLLLATAALGLTAGTPTTVSAWNLTGTLTCRSVGVTGELIGTGKVILAPRLAAETIPALMTSENSVPPLGAMGVNNPVVVDTTVDKLLSFTARYSVNSTSYVQCHQRLIEALN